MRFLREFFARVGGTVSKDQHDDDLRAELEAHLEMETAEYIRRGNDNNLIKESLIRVSLGLDFTDFWFGKRKYD